MRIDTLNYLIVPRLVIVAIYATMRAAALALSNRHIGLVVVCDNDGIAEGVVSKSDLVRHMSFEGTAEASITAQMTRDIVSCSPQDDLYSAWKVMAAQSLKSMPVLGADSRPLGVLDIRDALKVLFEQEQNQEHLLSNYIAGVGYQ